MFNFVRIKGLPLDVQFSYQNMYTFNRVMVAPLKLTSDKLKRQASREDNMTLKEYRKKLLELELKPITNSKDLEKFNNDRDKLLCEFKGWKNQQARKNDTKR